MFLSSRRHIYDFDGHFFDERPAPRAGHRATRSPPRVRLCRRDRHYHDATPAALTQAADGAGASDRRCFLRGRRALRLDASRCRAPKACRQTPLDYSSRHATTPLTQQMPVFAIAITPRLAATAKPLLSARGPRRRPINHCRQRLISRGVATIKPLPAAQVSGAPAERLR